MITKELLLELGFDCKTTKELESNQSSHKYWWTKDGDDVYIHNTKDIWFQGIPQAERLFNIIYNSGRKHGISDTRHEIRKSLGF